MPPPPGLQDELAYRGFPNYLLDKGGSVSNRLLASPHVRSVLVRSRARRTERYNSTGNGYASQYSH